MPDTPLRPDELDTYKTDVQTDAEAPESGGITPSRDTRPWIALGLVLLALFVVTLLAAIAFGLGG